MTGYFEPAVAIYRVTGEKAGNLLHGQLSNHINGLKPFEANYNLLLTQKGKVAGDLFVYRRESDYLMVIDRSSEQKVVDHLKKFAPLSRVQINEETSKYCLVHAFGTTKPEKFSCLQSDRLGLTGYDLIVPADKKEELSAWLKNRNLPKITQEVQEILRVEHGVCKVGVDATEDNLPQESRLDRALHFDKGCYLGQETIARLHFLGHVNKILAGLKINSDRPVETGTSVFEGEKEVGKITSCIFSPRLGSVLALGYIPFSSNQAGHEFQVGDKKIEARMVELPLSFKPQNRPAA